MLKPTLNKKQCDFINVTKITRLAIPGFWPNACAPWKTGFSHQVRSRGCSKWSSFSWKFLSSLTFMTSLDGKNLSACIGPKPGNSQPCYFSNIAQTYYLHNQCDWSRTIFRIVNWGNINRNVYEACLSSAITYLLSFNNFCWTLGTKILKNSSVKFWL